MAVDSVGNVVQAPGFSVTAATTDDEILASTAGFTQLGVTLKPAKGVLAAGTVLARVTSTKLYVPYLAATSEVQTVTLNSGASSGTFTLSFSGETTGNIAYDANATAVQTALRALSNIGDTDVTVAAGDPAGWVVTFTGQYAGTNVPALTGDATNISGGTPAVNVTTGTAGGAAGADGAGSEVPRGILRHAVDTGAAGATTRWLGNLVVHGIVKYSKLVGSDSNVVTTLNARVDVPNDLFVF